MIAEHEALIVHRDAVVERFGIGNDRPCVPGRVHKLPHEVMLPNRIRTGHFDCAVQGLGEGHIGHDGGDVIRYYGLNQNRWNPNRLPFSRKLGDSADDNDFHGCPFG